MRAFNLANFKPKGAAAALLLDALGKPTATDAVGLRKLRSAYSGSCLRVRRSSDNAESDIGFASNVLDWAAVATFGATCYVATWYDQSGNVNNFTSGSQPLLNQVTRQIEFDGGSTILSTAGTNLTATNKVTILSVIKTNDATADRRILELSDSFNAHVDAFLLAIGGGGYTAAMYDGGYNIKTITANTSTRILTTVLDKSQTGSAQSVLRVDGGGTVTDAGAGTITGSFGNYPLNCGAFFDGGMKEIVVLPSAFNTTELGTAESNMNGFYLVY